MKLEQMDMVMARTIVKTAFPDYRGRKISWEVQNHLLNIKSYWDGGSRAYFAFVRLDTMAVMPVPAQSMFDKQIQGGEHVILPAGCCLVRNSCFCGKWIGCTIYLPADDPADLRRKMEERYPAKQLEANGL